MALTERAEVTLDLDRSWRAGNQKPSLGIVADPGPLQYHPHVARPSGRDRNRPRRQRFETRPVTEWRSR